MAVNHHSGGTRDIRFTRMLSFRNCLKLERKQVDAHAANKVIFSPYRSPQQ